MSKNVLVIAPHPDDETLGCGGTLLKHKAMGEKVHWLMVTGMDEESGYSPERISSRSQEIRCVASMYDFNTVIGLDLPATRLEIVPLQKIIALIAEVILNIRPEIVYIPFPGDIHTDHRIVSQASAACSKWFRLGSVKRILAYETLSETDFVISPEINSFHPNVFVDISQFLDKKLEIMQIYKSEIGAFPFPRSEKAITALTQIRGAAAGCQSAEAFMLLKEII